MGLRCSFFVTIRSFNAIPLHMGRRFLILAVFLVMCRVCIAAPPAFETSFELPRVKKDPFLAEVWVHFKADKKEIRVPAFYDGDGQWRVRFTPREAGNYRLRVSVGKPQRSKPVRHRNLVQDEFLYDGTRAWNFVRVDPERTQRFVLDSGKPYFPIGDNCTLSLWSPYLGLSPDMFRHYFKMMKGTGFNYGRLLAAKEGNRSLFDRFWLGNNDLGARPSPIPPGVFDLKVAKFWDEIFAQADENGIRLQVCLDNQSDGSRHYQLVWHGSRADELEKWKKSSWNKSNGGFLSHPREIFTNAKAKRIFHARNRYFIARWGWSPALMALEICNEPYFYSVQHEDADLLEEWHHEMVDYIREVDPYGHLVTAGTGHGIVYDFVDFYQPHLYPSSWAADDGVVTNRFGISSGLLYGFVSHFAHDKLLGVPLLHTGDPWRSDKPIFYGEMGIVIPLKAKYFPGGFNHFRIPREYHEDRARMERRMLWESLFSGGAGAGMFWSNNGWIHHGNYWGLFRPACRFAELACFAENSYRYTSCVNDIEDVFGYAMASQSSAVGYLFHKRRLRDDLEFYSSLKGELSLQLVTGGKYKITWFDTKQGRAISESVADSTAINGRPRLLLQTPPFKRDLAVYAHLIGH